MQKYTGMYCRYIKRILDILITGLALILFCWLYAIVAILVRIFLGTPVIFTQERPGKIDSKTGEAQIFKLYKFRSMTNERDEKGDLLPDAQRLTRFGRILRATSMDEIPEAWNILKGDMSIVGPRPLLVRYLDYYTEFEMRRQRVRPGLTGWAQVHGRNATTWEKRFSYDSEYVDKISFAMDIKIVILTIKKVFSRDGIEFIEGHQSIADYFCSSSEKGEDCTSNEPSLSHLT